MNPIDLIVLFGTLALIVGIGVWRTRGTTDIKGFLLGDNSNRWWTIGLSVMATQASAITFLSTPGQAYDDGMRFIQFYFGLPIAMIILSVTFIPIYYKLKVYTAYEYLEGRFDLKTRTLTAILFLIQRGLACGITIYAPAIILSTILDWNLAITNIIIGVLVIIYTVAGGTKAVSVTQKQQMAVMMGGMIIAGLMILHYLPEQVGLGNAMDIAGRMGKLNIIDFEFDPNNRYNIWSGLIGGLFVALSYFGTDQSQVSRYLSGKSIKEIRLGLMFNGLLKIPMQFVILLIGVLVFVFYLFVSPPLFFNSSGIKDLQESQYQQEYAELEQQHETNFEAKRTAVYGLVNAIESEDAEQEAALVQQIEQHEATQKQLRKSTTDLLQKVNPEAETNDTDYVFISFVLNHLPVGLVGLLLAVIFSAAMSSTASELNALASTTTVDLYKRSVNSNGSEQHYLLASRGFTLMWGIIAIIFASVASLFDNLIEFINILGSLFYGTVLGVFLVAFYIKRIGGNAIFIAAIIAEALVFYVFFTTDIGYLWYNVIGCGATVLLGFVIQAASNNRHSS